MNHGELVEYLFVVQVKGDKLESGETWLRVCKTSKICVTGVMPDYGG